MPARAIIATTVQRGDDVMIVPILGGLFLSALFVGLQILDR